MRESRLLEEETLPSLVSYLRNHTCHNGEKKTKGKRVEMYRKRVKYRDREKKVPLGP